MLQPLIELGGAPDAPILHLAPANGFVPQTYQYFIQPFTEQFRVLSLPPRALWGDGTPPSFEDADDWSVLADDLLASMAHYGLQDVIGFGHSFGGVATILAALQKPEQFKAIVLLDPTILAPQIFQMIEFAVANNQHSQIPVVAGAQRRRTEYASVEEAFEHLRPKKLFHDWSDEALQLYVEHGTKPTNNGTRTLTWSAKWEAYYFGTGLTTIWDILPELANLDVPMLFLAGGDSDTFTPESASKVTDLVPNATHKAIEGYGHLFPQAAPDTAANIIHQWLQDNSLV